MKVHELSSQGAVEALNDTPEKSGQAVLRWFSGLDKPQLNDVYFCPKREVLTDKFRAIVESNTGRLDPEVYDVAQYFGQFGGRDVLTSFIDKFWPAYTVCGGS